MLKRPANWILTALIVIAIIVLQHRMVPNLTTPPNAQQLGDNLRVPVQMAMGKGGEQYWTLSRNSEATRYFVSVYNNYKLVREYATDGVIQKDASGTDYQVNGQININGIPYQATRLHVNTDGRSGYVLLHKEPQSPAGNQPGSNQSTNTAG